MSNNCKYLHGDWCYHPDLDYQELCTFYYENEKCPNYKGKVIKQGE